MLSPHSPRYVIKAEGRAGGPTLFAKADHAKAIRLVFPSAYTTGRRSDDNRPAIGLPGTEASGVRNLELDLSRRAKLTPTSKAPLGLGGRALDGEEAAW